MKETVINNTSDIVNVTTQPEFNKNLNKTLATSSMVPLKVILIGIIALIVLTAVLVPVVLATSKKDNNFKYKTTNKIPVIFDVDEGGDDMIAYTIANNSGKYDILGITTVHPSYCIDNVTDVWLRYLAYMNFDAKVYRGENHPLIRETQPINFSHFYNIDFPSPKKTIESKSAVDFMYDTIKNHKTKVTLFLLAPLTNFAKVIQRDKTIVDNVKEIIIMGGTRGKGNMYGININAEYNVYQDADAASIIFNSGATIRVMGCDITSNLELNDEIYAKYLEMNTTSSILTYNLVKGTFLTWHDNIMHDPVTVLYHLNNKAVGLKSYYVEVNTTDPDVEGTNYGTMYFFEPKDNIKANIFMAISIDLDTCWEILEEMLAKY